MTNPMTDRDGQGREALDGVEARIRHLELVAKQVREQGDVRQVMLGEDGVGEALSLADELWVIAYTIRAELKAHDAEVAAATAERIAGVVKEQREKYLDSPTLNPAWVAGWHAATDHIAHHVARADESNPR